MPGFVPTEHDELIALLTLGLALLCVLMSVFLLFFASARSRRTGLRLGFFLVVVLSGIAAADGLVQVHDSRGPVKGFGEWLGVLVCVTLCFQWAQSTPILWQGRWGMPVALLGMGIGVGGWVTISICHRNSQSLASMPIAQSEMDFKQKWFPSGVIEVAPPDPSYVCHDFAFFGGPSNVRWDSVEQLLEERNLMAVEQPQPGNVAVYRTSSGDVLHSAVVKAVGKEGFILLESKWGAHGLLLHEPTVKGFPQAFTITYYGTRY
jgi:hypothetical protein